MQYDPLVSVIIPSYNHSSFIGDAIKSVLHQSYKNIEIIIADDCSTDNSRTVIETFKDSRITKIYRVQNEGGVNNLNKAILIANGRYIAILNSDDYWEERKIEEQVQFLEQNSEYGAVFSNCHFIDFKGKKLTKKKYLNYDIFNQRNRNRGEWLKTFLFEQNCICHPSILIRKEIYSKVGLYDPRFRQLPDFKMWIEILKYTNIYVLEEKLVYFRILKEKKNASADTNINKLRTKNELRIIIKSFFVGVHLELFLQGFRDKLIRNNISTEEEMLCEQAFLLLSVEKKLDYLYHTVAIEKFYELLSREETTLLLERQYRFTYNDFFELTKHNNFCSLGRYDVYSEEGIRLSDKGLFLLKKIRDAMKK